MNSTLLSRASLVAATLVLGGCSRSDPVVTVTGNVTVSGTAVGPSSVQFHPADGGRPIFTSAREGKYRIVVPPGEYNVVVQNSMAPPAGWQEGDPLPPPKVAIPRVYTTRSTTKLNIHVQEAGEMTHDLQL